MESGWRNSFHGGANGSSRGHTTSTHFTNNITNAWDDHIWVDHNNITTTTTTTPYHNDDNWSTTATVPDQAGVVHSFLLGVDHRHTPDPHMTTLKLGKRHYYEDTAAVVVPDRPQAVESSPTTTKRSAKPPHPCYITTTDTAAATTATATTVWPVGARVKSSASSSQGVPRCQVEGCHVALGNVKEYYRRHKVCEIHSKAPKVVVLGLQQRFCQQCSRFHGVTEFDEAKRSCRRRLKGHNQRRRKGTLLQRTFPHPHIEAKTGMLEPRLPPSPGRSSLSQTKLGCALSLLSSPEPETWNSSSDLASRCSAALYELIAANRATSIFGHYHDSVSGNMANMSAENEMWDRYSQSNASTTLDLQQAPALEFGLLSMKEKSKEAEEWTDYCWSSFGGANVV